MNPTEYIKKALRTENSKYSFKKTNGVTPRMEHAIMGIVTEAGELMDEVKKAKIYGKKLDNSHIIEEIGDTFWYLALLCDELKISFEEVWDKNIRKLKVRYPKKYSKKNALKRKLTKERRELKK